MRDQAPSSPLPHSAEQLDALAARAKAELRKRMRAVRAAVPPAAAARRSRALLERLFALEAYAQARTVAAFVALDDEVQTQALLERALRDGKRVALPVVTEAPHLTFRAPFEGPLAPREGEPAGQLTERDPARFVRSSFGVLEPRPEAPEVPLDALDLVVVPALAADPRGHRIGYGRGYYDRTLERVRPDCVAACVLFSYQLIAEVPARAGDVAVRFVLTDVHTIDAREPTPTERGAAAPHR